MKFDMGRAWADALVMLGANREVLLVLAGIFFFLPGLLLALIGPDLGAIMGADPSQLEQLSAMMAAIYAEWWWLFLIVWAAQLVGYLAILALLRDDGRPTVGAAIGAGLRALLPALATYLLFVFAAIALFALVIAPGAASGSDALVGVLAMLAVIALAYVVIKVSLAAPVIAVEKVMNPIAVLARSWRLTRGNSLRLFAFFMLLLIAYVVLSAVLGIVVLGLVALLGPEAGRIVNGLASGLVGTAATVVFVAVLAATHRQLAGPATIAVPESFS